LIFTHIVLNNIFWSTGKSSKVVFWWRDRWSDYKRGVPNATKGLFYQSYICWCMEGGVCRWHSLCSQRITVHAT